MKTAAMMTTTFAQEPGNMEDTMVELRLSCPKVFSSLNWSQPCWMLALKEVIVRKFTFVRESNAWCLKASRVCCARQLYTAESHVMSLGKLHHTAARFHSVSFSKPIPVWFGKKKWNFARRRFQTKFRLVWKILMTIVNVLKIPNQIQFGLEKSLTIANALNQFQFYFVKSHFSKGKNSNI